MHCDTINSAAAAPSDQHSMLQLVHSPDEQRQSLPSS
jgi:hypothetical protein